MRYRVELIGALEPFYIEAIEFHAQQNGVTFFAERNRPQAGGTNDTWGNPRMFRQRVAVAYVSDVRSIIEEPEVNPGIPEITAGVFDAEAGVPFNMGGAWFDEAPTRVRGVGRAHAIEPITVPPVDDDGVNWDTQRVE